MVLWILPPVSDHICRARWWLMGLGMVIFSGGVFCRSYQLKKIHHLIKNGRFQSTKNLDHIKLLVILMGLITFIQLIILLILQFIAPFKSEKPMIDPINLRAEYQCISPLPFLWLALVSGYLFCILILGVYIIYSTWKISSSVDDTRINILTFFICLVTLIVANVVWSYSPQGEDADSWWAISVIMVWGLCMICSVFIPKLVKAAKESTSSGEKSTKTVNSPSTM